MVDAGDSKIRLSGYLLPQLKRRCQTLQDSSLVPMSTLLKLLCRPTWAGATELIDAYERAFASTIADGDMPALAFWKGRVAFWTILRAVGITEGDEVVLPAYTCEMVPISVRFAGAKCAYVDVENPAFNASPERVAEAVTERTRVVLCQHTYGIPQPVQKLEWLLHGKLITLIEDCCQLVSADLRHTATGRTGDASFFSTQWNKPFSTGLGGMAVFKDPDLYSRAKDIRATFHNDHEQRRAWLLALQILFYRLTVRPSTRTWVGTMYRSAQRLGWNQGTTSVGEYEDAMPLDYLAGATNVQAMFGLDQLRNWPDNVRHRKTLTDFYLNCLPSLGVDTAPLKAGSSDPVLWAVPLLVDNKSEILRLAARRGLAIATWFDHPQVHIDPATAARYDYRPGQCPRSEKMFSREIHLPTSPWVTLRQAEKTVAFLRRFAHFANLDR